MSQSQDLGYQPISTLGSGYNSQYAIIQSILSGVHTATLAQVVKVTNGGGISPVGMVDLQPLVNQVSGAGYAVAQGIVHNAPYFRLQGGSNAIIIDPKIGDIGILISCDRDISSAVSNKAQSNPGSGRQYDISDGLFIGGFLGDAPMQYIRFHDGGVEIISPNLVTITAPIVNVNASTSMTINSPHVTMTGNLQVDGSINADVDVIGDGTSLHTHDHNVLLVQTGTSTITTTEPL